MRIQLTLTLIALLTGATLSRSCRICGGSAYYDVARPSHRYLKTVCGANGLTYKNQCYAKCNEVEINHRGACNASSQSESDMPCGCESDFAPVQSMSGQMYRNKCVANCYGVEALEMTSSDSSPAETTGSSPTEIPHYLVQETASQSEDSHDSVHKHSVDPRNSDSGLSHSSHSRSTLYSRSNSTSEMNDPAEWAALVE